MLKNTLMTGIFIFSSLLIAQGHGHGGNHGGGHHGGNHGGGHHNGGTGSASDTLTVSGFAEVYTDTMHCNIRSVYFLDTDGNDTVDIKLAFGPEGYVPASGAVRPENGDSITVTGPVYGWHGFYYLVVWTLNDLEWVNPDSGYGVVNDENSDLDSIAVTGTVFTEIDSSHGHTRTKYYLDSNNDGTADYSLMLRHWLHSDSSAVAPENGASVYVEGLVKTCVLGTSKLLVTYLESNTAYFSPLAVKGLGADSYQITAKSFPNPFNPTTTITYSISAANFITVKVFNLLGQEIKTLQNGFLPSGTHQLSWNGTDHSGNAIPGGMYIYVIKSGADILKQKMLYLK